MQSFLKVIHSIPSDVVAMVAVFAVFFFYTIYFGKNRTVSLILAYYPAVLLFKIFPWVEKLTVLHGDNLLLVNKLGIFLLFLIPLGIILNRYIFIESEFGKTHILKVGGLALVCAVLTLIFSYTVLDLSLFHSFGPSIGVLFATPTKVFIANLLPLAFLAFL